MQSGTYVCPSTAIAEALQKLLKAIGIAMKGPVAVLVLIYIVTHREKLRPCKNSIIVHLVTHTNIQQRFTEFL